MLSFARLALIALALVATVATADTFEGRVVRVLDGDTVDVLDAGKSSHRVRLAGIDAPEKGQAFGTRAKQLLLELAGGKSVEVSWHKRDRYG